MPNIKNLVIIGGIAFVAVWGGNYLLRKMGAAQYQA